MLYEVITIFVVPLGGGEGLKRPGQRHAADDAEIDLVVAEHRLGGVDYVTKPIVPDELIARIGVHITNARLAQSARAALHAAGRSLLAVTP